MDGSSLEDWLESEEFLEEVTIVASERVRNWVNGQNLNETNETIIERLIEKQ